MRAPLLLLLLVVAAPDALAADVRSAARAVEREVRHGARDAASLTTQPLRWKSTQWKRFGTGLLAVGVLYAADESIDERVQANRSDATDRFSEFITPFGGGRGLQMSVLMIAAGSISGSDRVRDAGRDALESEIWAAGVVTPLLKRGFGRSRPNRNEGARLFDPFRPDKGFESFPSGHATNAFAFATAVAGHFNGWVVPTIVYTMASGVAMSRVNDRVHFSSDVLAGALIGRAVAKGVLGRHGNWKAVPIRTSEGTGLLLRMSWN